MSSVTVLAVFNVEKLLHPLDHPEIREFAEALERVNALAEAAPGFRGRVRRTFTPYPDKPRVIANLAFFADVESLKGFTYRGEHGRFFAERAKWFARYDRPKLVLWWWTLSEELLAADDALAGAAIPEGLRRLELLRANGSGPEAFTFREPWPKPV